MSSEKSKWIEVIAKLIKLTQEGRIQWRSASTSFVVTDQEGITGVFVAEYREKLLRIYRYKYQVEEPDQPAWLSATMAAVLNPTSSVKQYPYWTSRIVLEFVNENGMTLWTFPVSDTLNDLFKAVQYQAAGVQEFLDDILSEE